MIAAYIWIIIGILLLIVEIFTVDFLFATLGIACFVASLPAFLGAGFLVQSVVFGVSAVLIFMAIRPFAQKVLKGTNHAKELGLNTLINKTGTVTEKIVNSENRGQVKIDADLWKAVSETGEDIEEGAQIIVKRTESITVFVERR